MGASASISIHPPHIQDQYFKELLAKKELRSELFHKIAKSEDGHIALKHKISLKKLVAFFTAPDNPIYKDFMVNMDILKLAFKHTHTVKEKSKDKKQEQINEHQFHVFLPTLFLYSKLYEIFNKFDRTCVEDDKIYRGEFIRSKALITQIEGIQSLADISAEDWEKEFDKLDNDKRDGYITFAEFCTYCVRNIIKPSDYVDEFELYNDDLGVSVDEEDASSHLSAAVSEQLAKETSDITPEETILLHVVTATDLLPVTAVESSGKLKQTVTTNNLTNLESVHNASSLTAQTVSTSVESSGDYSECNEVVVPAAGEEELKESVAEFVEVLQKMDRILTSSEVTERL